jgi:hypothetical protein
MGTGMNNTVWVIILDESDNVYAGGDFTTAGGNTVNRITQWNGTDWLTMGTGADSTVVALSFGPDGMLFISGFFTTIGGLTLTDRLARWTGTAYAHLDIDWPGAPQGWAVLASSYVDPVIPDNYNLYYGFDTTGTGYYSGTVTASLVGNATEIEPVIYVGRTGGTSATLVQIRNETLGQTLLFDYDLLDGETLTIDLRGSANTVTSSFFGRRDNAMIEGSTPTDFYLRAGDNQITSFVSVAGAPTIEAYILYRQRYWSVD